MQHDKKEDAFKNMLNLVKDEEDRNVQKVMEDIKAKNDRQLKEDEIQKQTILKKIEGTLDEAERKRLID